jgi:hypothetical protein
MNLIYISYSRYGVQGYLASAVRFLMVYELVGAGAFL